MTSYEQVSIKGFIGNSWHPDIKRIISETKMIYLKKKRSSHEVWNKKLKIITPTLEANDSHELLRWRRYTGQYLPSLVKISNFSNKQDPPLAWISIEKLWLLPSCCHHPWHYGPVASKCALIQRRQRNIALAVEANLSTIH